MRVGATSLHNSAVVNGLAHPYIHSLPRHQEEIVNNMLREYKLNFTEMNGDMIGEHGSIELGIADDYLEIELHDITPEVKKKREKFNRAKEKRNFNKRVEEELEDYERE